MSRFRRDRTHLLEKNLLLEECQTIEGRRNGRSFTTWILKNSMVFSCLWWIISVEVDSHWWHSKQLCGRMEISWQVALSCSIEAMLNQLKALLTKNVLRKFMLNMNKNSSFRSHQTCKRHDECIQWYCSFMKFLFCYTGIRTLKLSLESVNLYKFMAWCPAVQANKLHPLFDRKILTKKV